MITSSFLIFKFFFFKCPIIGALPYRHKMAAIKEPYFTDKQPVQPQRHLQHIPSHLTDKAEAMAVFNPFAGGRGLCANVSPTLRSVTTLWRDRWGVSSAARFV